MKDLYCYHNKSGGGGGGVDLQKYFFFIKFLYFKNKYILHFK